jgi:GNAT superfamily N-acetyltransferase
MLIEAGDLSYLINPAGGTAQIGPEKTHGRLVGGSGILHFVSPHGSHRFVLYQERTAVGGLQVMTRDGKTGRIANVYVKPVARRAGVATKLLKRAREVFDSVAHSDDLSADARAWKAATDESLSEGQVTFVYWDGKTPERVHPYEDGVLRDAAEMWKAATAVMQKLPGAAEMMRKARRVVVLRRTDLLPSHQGRQARAGYVHTGGMRLAPGTTRKGDVIVGTGLVVDFSSSSKRKMALRDLVHELGHAYWYEVVSREQALAFIDQHQAMDRHSGSYEPYAFVSSYANTNPEEDFAESLAEYLFDPGIFRRYPKALTKFKAALAEAREDLSEAAKAIFNLPDGIGVRINRERYMASPSGWAYEIEYWDTEWQRLSVRPRGSVVIGPTNRVEGKCSGAMVVYSSDAERGWGPLLYDIAMELATKLAGGLTSDRQSVSRFAHAVWAKYLTRSDVSHAQLDDHPDGPLTPHDKDDDCLQSQARKYAPTDDWTTAPESKVYRKAGMTTIRTLSRA